MTDALLDVLQAARRTLVSSARDMSGYRVDAWLYGVFVGWPDDTLAELVSNGTLAQEHADGIRTHRRTIDQQIGTL